MITIEIQNETIEFRKHIDSIDNRNKTMFFAYSSKIDTLESAYEMYNVLHLATKKLFEIVKDKQTILANQIDIDSVIIDKKMNELEVTNE